MDREKVRFKLDLRQRFDGTAIRAAQGQNRQQVRGGKADLREDTLRFFDGSLQRKQSERRKNCGRPARLAGGLDLLFRPLRARPPLRDSLRLQTLSSTQ